MSTMAYFDWVDKYEPVSDEPLEWEDIKGVDRKYIWTAVETDIDHYLILITGQHIVNHLYFMQCKNPHNYEDIEVY